MTSFNWQRDEKAPHRFLCTPDNPMPKEAPGLWSHTNIKDVGSCYEGCCDDYVCLDCGVKWRVENAD